jgi:imidazolonepropionase-like amidohydrolase
MKTFKLLILLSFVNSIYSVAQNNHYLIIPERVFDGEQIHEGWVVLVEGNKISAVGPAGQVKAPAKTTVLEMKGTTLLPGLIEGHSHILLHPYNETSWDDQVLKESDAVRIARATVHAKKTLLAGFTTIRDLGSEGAGYADVGIKQAISEGIIPGPPMLVAGRAIVATGSYGPKGFDTDFSVMLGAEAADVHDLVRVVRDQIGKGADIVKVYADYRWGLNNQAQPTFSEEELKLIVETAKSSGRPVVAHASTAEGMRRAVLAGVETIEHGDDGTTEVFKLMKEKGVALCPTIAAGDAVSQYKGWKKGDPEPPRIATKRKTFKEALAQGVVIVAGGDVGVFAHGDNARELELMVEYGMSALDVLRSATSVNARIFHQPQIGKIQKDFFADLLLVTGNPGKNISEIRNVVWVMKDGQLYKKD